MTTLTLEQQAALRRIGLILIEQMQYLQTEVVRLHNEVGHLEQLLIDKRILNREELSTERRKEFLEESLARIMGDLKMNALKADFLELLDGKTADATTVGPDPRCSVEVAAAARHRSGEAQS
jgi:hypothetical protein